MKNEIQLAVGSPAQCTGIGAIITRLTPRTPPILLAPVYYCPKAKVSTLSPSALKMYNSISDIKINIHDSMEYTSNHSKTSQHEIPIAVHNQLDYISLPVLHLSSLALTNPTLASLF